MKTCIECSNPNYARQRCKLHYDRLRAKETIGRCRNCFQNKSFRSKKARLCGACYEGIRRRKIIQEAKTDPEKQKALKEYYRKEYLKSKNKGNYETLSRRISTQLNAFKTRDPLTDIDWTWFYENVVNKTCYYCGIDEDSALKLTKNKLHVDRLDPEKGYRKDNCVPACKACNTAKLNYWTPEETKILGKFIKKFYDKRLNKSNVS